MWFKVTFAFLYCIPLEVSVKIRIYPIEIKKIYMLPEKDKMDKTMEPKKGANLENIASRICHYLSPGRGGGLEDLD